MRNSSCIRSEKWKLAAQEDLLTTVLLFAVWLGWLPAGGTGSWQHYVLPPLALALPFVAAIARLTRGSVAEVMLEP